MPEQRRKFSPQFKAEAVQMVIEGGRTTAEVARDLGMHAARWAIGSTPGAGPIATLSSP